MAFRAGTKCITFQIFTLPKSNQKNISVHKKYKNIWEQQHWISHWVFSEQFDRFKKNLRTMEPSI